MVDDVVKKKRGRPAKYPDLGPMLGRTRNSFYRVKVTTDLEALAQSWLELAYRANPNLQHEFSIQLRAIRRILGDDWVLPWDTKSKATESDKEVRTDEAERSYDR